MDRQRPGGEIPKDFRKIIEHLIDTQGWRYQWNGSGYPKLFPADATHPPISVPKTPSSQRSLPNFIAAVRRVGGVWPPERKPQHG